MAIKRLGWACKSLFLYITKKENSINKELIIFAVYLNITNPSYSFIKSKSNTDKNVWKQDSLVKLLE